MYLIRLLDISGGELKLCSPSDRVGRTTDTARRNKWHGRERRTDCTSCIAQLWGVVWHRIETGRNKEANGNMKGERIAQEHIQI